MRLDFRLMKVKAPQRLYKGRKFPFRESRHVEEQSAEVDGQLGSYEEKAEKCPSALFCQRLCGAVR